MSGIHFTLLLLTLLPNLQQNPAVQSQVKSEKPRTATVSGRVTDSSGRPLARLLIELTKVGDDGKPQPLPFNHPVVKMTDEQGVYRIRSIKYSQI